MVRRKRRRGAKHHHFQLELIDGWWLVGAKQRNNQPPNQIERVSIEFVSWFGEQQT
jgi:hypothetical protein